MKVFRILGLTLVGILLLLVAIVVIATLVIDPNSYKPQIESAAEKATNLELTLAGDIDWSLIPLGLSLNDVSADLDGESFASLDTLVAQVNFWSLLRFEPAVDTFILEGMTANLVRNESGQGNWERIMAESGTAASQPQSQPAETVEPQTSEPAQPLSFEIAEVRITDAQLRYRDLATGQDILLDQVDVTAQDISLGSSFPLDLSFHFATNQPALDVNGTISAAVTASHDLKQFAVSDLSSNFDISGEPVGNKTVEASFSGDFAANLTDETAELSDIRAQLINLVLRTELRVNGFGDNAELSGSLEIEPFSARELLSQLGQDPIETQDPQVLTNLALETTIGGAPGEIALSKFLLTLDDTRFSGDMSYALKSGAIGVDLQGDTLNLDRYLPPASESEEVPEPESRPDPETADSGSAGTPSTPAAPEADLLPLETLRGLIFDVRLGLAELIAKNLRINAIEVKTTGKDGLIRIDPIKGQMYDGDFLVTAQLDARSDIPRWQISNRLNGIATLPLLTDLAELDMLSGNVNMQADVTTQGNLISALRENARGNASFDIADGAFESVNLTALACQGIALANGETIDTQQWPSRTQFEDLSGIMQINGNMLANEDLSADLAGMALQGNGTIDLAEMLLDYELGLRIVGAIHKDNACRVNPRIQNIVIPLECRGSLDQAAGLCSFDGSRFRDVLKDMAVADAKRKAGEAVDKQLDKILGEDEGGEAEGARKQLKDAVKGLFD